MPRDDFDPTVPVLGEWEIAGQMRSKARGRDAEGSGFFLICGSPIASQGINSQEIQTITDLLRRPPVTPLRVGTS